MFPSARPSDSQFGRRTVHCLLAVAVVTLGFPTLRQSKAGPKPNVGQSTGQVVSTTLEDITKAYRGHYKAVKTLKVVYEQVMTPLVDMDVLWNHRMSYEWPPSTYTVVSEEGKLYYRYVTKRTQIGDILDLLEKDKPARFPKMKSGQRFDLRKYGNPPLTYAEIKEKLPLVEPEKYWSMRMYDGSTYYSGIPGALIVGQPRETSYAINDTTNHEKVSYLGTHYPDRVLFGMPLPGLRTDSEQHKKNRVPDLFSYADFSVSERIERVSGTDCVVLEAPGHEKLWLDPQRGFALLRREQYSKGHLSTRTECGDLVEVVPGVWMPKKVTLTTFAGLGIWPNLPEQYHGKPWRQTTLRVKTLEVNDPKHQEYFKFRPEPGAPVHDLRLRSPEY